MSNILSDRLVELQPYVSESHPRGLKHAYHCPLCDGKLTVGQGGFMCWDCEDTTGITRVLLKDENALSPEEIEQRKRDWAESRRQNREKVLETESARQAIALPTSERDSLYRDIIANLQLSQAHRDEMKRRGISWEIAFQAGFRTVAQWQKVRPTNPNLPGVSIDGDCLITPGSGYILPKLSARGQILAFEIAMNDKRGGKYKHLSSTTKKRPNAPTPHLKETGEQPLTVCWPADRSRVKRIGLIEGTGKPFYSAHLDGETVFVGCFGGQFFNSPAWLMSEIEEIRKMAGQKLPVVFYPDAGSLVNSGVAKRDWKTLTILDAASEEVTIADWGHGYDKSRFDYDDLLNQTPAAKSSIKFVDVDTWFANCVLDADDVESRREPGQTRRDVRKRILTEKVKREMRRLDGLDDIPTTEHELRYLSSSAIALPRQKGVTVVKSPMGTGKTELLAQWLREDSTLRVLVIGYRNALGRQTVERLSEFGSTVLADASLDQMRNSRVMFLCADSLKKLEMPWWDGSSHENTIVFIDECESVFPHALLGGTINANDRCEILGLMGELFRGNRHIILADAAASSKSVRTVRAIASQEFKAHAHVNKYDTAIAYPVTWFDGSIGSNGKATRTGCDEALQTHLLSAAADRKKCLIQSSSRIWLHSIEELLVKSFGAKTLRIDSKVLSGDHGKELQELAQKFIQDPDAFILAHDYDFYLCSPSVESGLSITVPYFDRVYALFQGGETTHQAALQMLGRYRVPVERFIAVNAIGGQTYAAHSPFVSVLESRQSEVNRENLHAILEYSRYGLPHGLGPDEIHQANMMRLFDPVTKRYSHPWLTAWCEYTASANCSKFDLAGNLYESLEADGKTITKIMAERDDEIEEDRQAVADEIIDAEAAREADAPGGLNREDALEILRRDCVDPGLRYSAQKSLLQDRVPGREITPEFVRLVRHDDRAYLRRIELRVAFLNPSYALVNDAKRLRTYDRSQTLLFDWGFMTLKVKALSEIDLMQWVERSEDWTRDDVDAWYGSLTREQRSLVDLAFGVSVRRDSLRFLHACLRFLGYNPTRKSRGKKGEPTMYGFSEDKFEGETVVAIQKRFEAAYQEYITPDESNDDEPVGSAETVTASESQPIAERATSTTYPYIKGITWIAWLANVDWVWAWDDKAKSWKIAHPDANLGTLTTPEGGIIEFATTISTVLPTESTPHADYTRTFTQHEDGTMQLGTALFWPHLGTLTDGNGQLIKVSSAVRMFAM